MLKKINEVSPKVHCRAQKKHASSYCFDLYFRREGERDFNDLEFWLG